MQSVWVDHLELAAQFCRAGGSHGRGNLLLVEVRALRGESTTCLRFDRVEGRTAGRHHDSRKQTLDEGCARQLDRHRGVREKLERHLGA